VRTALEVLVRSKKFDHASAMLKAALRNGISEPWMYEALAVVQEANNEDKEEIKRTLLSAADVTEDSPDAQYRVARSLARHGLKETAIGLYRKIADTAPDAPQPYAESLDLAAETGDVATVTWAATHILSQAWVGVHDELHRKARSRAAETEQRLRKADRAKEADELAERVRQADSRDLVVRVTWQGDADIDLKVLEPLGTVCSAQNRMTPAGGVLVQDSYGKDPGSTKNPAELYICPRGLPGDYEIRLERVWGNPQGGRVKVEVIYADGTPDAKRETHFVAVTSTKPLVVKLESGRRTQLLAIPQFVTPPFSPEHAQTPYQQLIAYANSQAGQHGYTGPQALHQFGRVGGGAVAFNPTVQQFFFGAGLGVQAVVSADRRYVRISAFPSFTQLAGEKRFTVTGAVGGGGGGF
jgi:tetratricopeptide (TPR) repeat protein